MRRRTARTRPAAALALLTAAAAVLGGSGPSGAAPAAGAAQAVTGLPQAAAAAGQEQDGACKPTPVAPSTVDGASVKAIKAKGTLIIGVDQNSYRWGARNPRTGELEGFDIDLARRIGRDIMGDDKKVKLKPVATADRIPALTATDGSGVDLVIRTMTVRCDQPSIAFSHGYFNIKQRVLVPHSSQATDIGGALTGKTVCAATGSVAETVLSKRPGQQILRVDNQLDCLVRMQLGQVDATMTDDELAAGQSAQDQTVRLVDGFEQPEEVGVAMRQDRPDLIARVNQVIGDFYRDKNAGWEHSFEQWVQPFLPDGSKDPALYWPAE
ncbi:transporter substrate-binding domain-containing protein [Kitasatospora sp. NPDC056446]|uniref:transporter substrate-binding domain-containing protein n=1 Tax=Kitasatospora sp. NPDC056446 TaxID=3345819 RepID=UPI003677227A